MSEWDDSEIIRTVKIPGQEELAFNQLVQKYQERLYWHIRKIVLDHDDADDVLQNTMIKVWKSLANFRSESGLYTWLYRIATNESLSFLKLKKKKSFAPWVDVEQRMGEDLEADPWFCMPHLADDDFIRRFATMVNERLDPSRFKYEEMSEILGTSVGALKASYHHAVKKIESMLGGD